MAKPNVVLIMADDMGYGDLGLFSDGSACTPALDQLGKEGICLTQHYSASCVCAPARASMLTGRYPHRTGVLDTFESTGLDRLSLDEVTIAELLKAGGYATGCVGKWHLGAFDRKYHPNARGFDEFAGFRGGWSDYYDYILDYNGKFQKSDGTYITDVFTDESIQFIRRHKHEPFFLNINYTAPHFPMQAPQEEVKPFLDSGKYSDGASIVYGMIRRMDRGIEKVMDELSRQGVRDNTIVLFVSDNGPAMSYQNMSLTRYNGGFRGEKCNVFEGGIRVPAIISWPVGLNQDQYVNGMVHFTDWLPTLLEMVGIQLPRNLNLDGRSVSNALNGQGNPQQVKRFWQWNRYMPVITSNAAMRDGTWKLVRPVIKETMQVLPEDAATNRRLMSAPETVLEINGGPEPERVIPDPSSPLLFDLAEDPYEEVDLASRHPQRVKQMLNELEDWFTSVEKDRTRLQKGAI
jgi:arylsulfatase A